MKNLRELDEYRDEGPEVIGYFGSPGDETCGVFHVPTEWHAFALKCVAATGEGWDHVSVSLPDRTPTWQEMDLIARMFFRENETAMQLHGPASEHVNLHAFTLHLWRLVDGKIPMPPKSMV